MKTVSKTVLLTLTVTLLGSGVGFSEQVVRRIDHPNGHSTYVPAHQGRLERVPTIGVYAGETGYQPGGRDVAVRYTSGRRDIEGRATIPIHRGRGEVIHVPVQP